MNRSIVSILFASALAGCSQQVTETSEVPAEATQIAAEQVRALVKEYSSGVTAPARDVIRSSQKWSDFWTQVYANRSPVPALPAVNFNDKVVVAVAQGQKPSGGYSVDIAELYRRGDALYVVVKETKPGRTCGTTAALTQPVHAVEIPRTDGNVFFITREVVTECS
jgi:hypothetical protein